MEFDPHDQDIIKLLTKLKNAEGEYPEHMFVARRHMYLKRMAEIGMGISMDPGIEHAAKSTNAPAVPVATSTLLETALLIAIIVETSAVAYFYRDRLADFFQTLTTDKRAQEVTPPPVATTATELQGVTPSAAVTATIPSAVLSASPTDLIMPVTGTPIPGVAGEENTGTSSNTINNSGTGAGGNQNDSTPVPNVDNDNNTGNGNNGNHYGQTPKPERTIENSGNNDPSPQDSGPPSPSEDQSSNNKDKQPPQDQPEPTKSK